MKSITIVGVVAACIAATAATYINITLNKQVDRLAPKAEKFDAVCSLAKTALFLDRKRLDEPQLRDQMLDDFAGYRIGDGYVMLEWCVPNAAESVAEVRRCTSLRDYQCIERVFRAMEASIVP